jgi:hypothetical protein
MYAHTHADTHCNVSLNNTEGAGTSCGEKDLTGRTKLSLSTEWLSDQRERERERETYFGNVNMPIKPLN